MYLGMLIALLAWAIYLPSALAFLGPVAFALYITRFQILPEERAMHSLFGSAFSEYSLTARYLSRPKLHARLTTLPPQNSRTNLQANAEFDK
jgi:protein-S-isoprenylcysteine O-methyltransferase Ste14